MSARRRGLMGGAETPAGPTKLTAGEYTNGTSSWVVDATGKVTINNWTSAAAGALIMPMDRSISIKQDDEIVFYLLRKSGSPGWKGTDVQLNRSSTRSLLSLVVNKSWNYSNNTNSVSKTSTVTGEATHIYLVNRGSTITNDVGYSFTLRMTINGKDVLA